MMSLTCLLLLMGLTFLPIMFLSVVLCFFIYIYIILLYLVDGGEL